MIVRVIEGERVRTHARERERASHLEGSFVLGEGVGYRGSGREHVPEVDCHTALPV